MRYLLLFLAGLFMLSTSACLNGPSKGDEGVFGKTNPPETKQSIPENMRGLFKDKLGKTYFEIDPAYQCKNQSSEQGISSYKSAVTVTENYELVYKPDLCGNQTLKEIDFSMINVAHDGADLLGYTSKILEPNAGKLTEYYETWCQTDMPDGDGNLLEVRMKRKEDEPYLAVFARITPDGKILSGFSDEPLNENAGLLATRRDFGSQRAYAFDLRFGSATAKLMLSVELGSKNPDGKFSGFIFDSLNPLSSTATLNCRSIISSQPTAQGSNQTMLNPAEIKKAADDAAVADAISQETPESYPNAAGCEPNQVCVSNEGEGKSISCESGVISILSSSYGARSNFYNCRAYIEGRCKGKPSCTYSFENDHCGGDPIPNVEKTGSLTYVCN